VCGWVDTVNTNTAIAYTTLELTEHIPCARQTTFHQLPVRHAGECPMHTVY
jgi:hypothetical protein